MLVGRRRLLLLHAMASALAGARLWFRPHFVHQGVNAQHRRLRHYLLSTIAVSTRVLGAVALFGPVFPPKSQSLSTPNVQSYKPPLPSSISLSHCDFLYTPTNSLGQRLTPSHITVRAQPTP